MSLIDTAAPGAEATPPASDGASPTTVPPNNDWYYDQDIKGNGARPDWLKEKYKTAADQAKAYVEVEKRLGAFKGAPDEYDLTLAEHPAVKFSADDPALKGFLESAKKNGVSQEYVSELLATYAQAMTANIPDADAEIAALGANGAQDVQLLARWGSSTFNKEEFGVFKKMLTTAESVRFFEKVRQMTTQSDVAPPANPNVSRETEEQVKQLINDPRYDKDPVFRADVRKRMAAALGVK